jgi:xyloglucan 6-xylosyltransferase
VVTMLERCIGERRLRQIQRSARNLKLTFVCLLLTLLVLRGTIGAGKYGTPQQDFIELRHRFISHPHRALAEQHQAEPKPKESDKDDEPPLRSLNDPYSLGPKISDWDSQRANWIRRHPERPNFLTKTKPRVLLVTGSSPKPCENPVGDHYLLKSIKNKIDYCRVHNIEIFYNMALLDAEMAGFWAKLPLIRALLLAHPEVEFLWWMDSDAMFTDMAFELPWER